MAATTMRILFVGKPSPHTDAVLARLRRKNLESHVVDTLREAQELLPTCRFDIVLAPEYLPDGRGYELTAPVARRSCTLLIAISLSETWLWLPVVERGAKVIGDRAVPADLLEPELEELLSERARENLRAARRGRSPRPERRVSKQIMPPRHKDVSATAHSTRFRFYCGSFTEPSFIEEAGYGSLGSG